MPFHHLSSDDITALHAAAVDAGLTARRGALLGGMDASFATRLDTDPSPSAQLLSDLHAPHGVESLTDDSVPLHSAALPQPKMS